MHAQQRERLIVEAMGPKGFVSYRDLETLIAASPATIRRDLTRMEEHSLIVRVHGGAKLVTDDERLRGPGEGVILLVDSSKFAISSGQIVCGLDEVDVIVTDSTIADDMRAKIEGLGVRLIVVDA
jgi:DeoR family ulaG and ulaABCDEF operon transcriptional repressor